MAKQSVQSSSPFSKLLELRKAKESQTGEQPPVETAEIPGQLNIQTSPRLAKSVDPEYTKFTTYVRKTTHRAAKLRAVEEGRELSDVVQELIADWAAGRAVKKES